MAQVAFAEPQGIGHLTDGQLTAAAVLSNIVHSLLNVAGLCTGTDFLQPHFGGLSLLAQLILQLYDGAFQIAVVEGLQ